MAEATTENAGIKYFSDANLQSLTSVGFNTFNLNFGTSLLNAPPHAASLARDFELTSNDANTLELALRLLSEVPLNLPTFHERPPFNPEEQSDTTLYVRNLPHSATQHDIQSLFQAYGQVKEVRMQIRDDGSFFGYKTFVSFFLIFLDLLLSSTCTQLQRKSLKNKWMTKCGEEILYISILLRRNKGLKIPNKNHKLYQNHLLVLYLFPEYHMTLNQVS